MVTPTIPVTFEKSTNDPVEQAVEVVTDLIATAVQDYSLH